LLVHQVFSALPKFFVSLAKPMNQAFQASLWFESFAFEFKFESKTFNPLIPFEFFE
jgi:hypothetical protein